MACTHLLTNFPFAWLECIPSWKFIIRTSHGGIVRNCIATKSFCTRLYHHPHRNVKTVWMRLFHTRDDVTRRKLSQYFWTSWQVGRTKLTRWPFGFFKDVMRTLAILNQCHIGNFNPYKFPSSNDKFYYQDKKLSFRMRSYANIFVIIRDTVSTVNLTVKLMAFQMTWLSTERSLLRALSGFWQVPIAEIQAVHMCLFITYIYLII